MRFSAPTKRQALQERLALHLPEVLVTLAVDFISLPQHVCDASRGSLSATGCAALVQDALTPEIDTLFLAHNGMNAAVVSSLASVLDLVPPNLTQLDLSHNRMGPAGCQALARHLPQCASLTNLSLDHYGIGDEGAAALARVLPHTQVTHLSVQGNNMTQIDSLLRVTSLRSLNAGHNQLGDDGFSGFIPLGLSHLDVSYNRIGSVGGYNWANALHHNTSVTHLNLGGNELRSLSFWNLACALLYSRVSHLDVSGNGLDDQDVGFLAAVLIRTRISHLNLSKNRVGWRGTSVLCECLPDTRLTHLNLSQNRIEEYVWTLAAGIPHSSLTHVDLSRNRLSPRTVVKLAEALADPRTKVQSLNLSSISLGRVPLERLVESLVHHPRVKHLDLSDNDINVVGVQYVVKLLEEHPGLHSLNLSFNDFGERGLSQVSKTLVSHRNLKSLNMSHNDMNDAHVLALAVAWPQMTQLTNLDLSGNKLGSDAVTMCAWTRNLAHSRLTDLNLNSNHICDVGAWALKDVLPHTMVQKLGLSFNNMSEIAVNHLLETLPDSYVTHLDVSDNLDFVSYIHPSWKETFLHELAYGYRRDDLYNPATFEILNTAYRPMTWYETWSEAWYLASFYASRLVRGLKRLWFGGNTPGCRSTRIID